MKDVLVFLALVSTALAQTSDLNRCTYTDEQGKVYDLSALISTSDMGYVWNQTVWDTTDNLYTNTNFSTPVKLEFQLQVCRNISKPMNAKCNTVAPVYMYNPSTGNCSALGRVDVATFNPNPFGDGVYLSYYNGDSVSHIVRWETRVYFVCDKSVNINGPVLEHVKESHQFHFHVATKYAC